MLWRTQPWFLWINVWKTCLVKLLPWIRQPSFGYSISPPSHWFKISSGRSEQVTGPCIWTPLERCCHSSMHRATFIMQNQHICTTRRCAACMMSWTWMNSRLIQRKASSPSGAATGSGAVSGLIWRIHHFPGIMVASWFHSLLASLVTPQLLAIMQRKLVSSSSNRWLERALLMSKWTGRVRWKL